MLPKRVRERLANNGASLIPAGHDAPEPDRWAGIPVLILLALFYGLFALITSLLGWLDEDGLTFVSMVCGGFGFFVMTSERRGAQLVWEYHRRYLCEADFDETALTALARARSAVARVQESTVNREGLLDTIDNAVVLPEQIWKIAVSLHNQTELRTHQESLGDGPFTAAVEAAIEPQRRAIEMSVADTERRIASLEAYAQRVRAADEAFLEGQRLHRVLERNDDYRRLVAKIDDSGADELRRLTDQADSVAKALTESLTLAGAAGQALVLPEDDGDGTSPEE